MAVVGSVKSKCRGAIPSKMTREEILAHPKVQEVESNLAAARSDLLRRLVRSGLFFML